LTDSIESKVQIEVLKRSLHCKPKACNEILRAEVGVRPLSSWLDQRAVEWWYKLHQKDSSSLSRQVFDATWPSHGNYASWQKHVDKLMSEMKMKETAQAKLIEPLASFRSFVRWCIYERDGEAREKAAAQKSTLAAYMKHYNDAIGYFKPQPYLCCGPLGKGTELILQLRAGVLPLKSVTARFGSREGSRQAEARQGCMSCSLGPDFGPGEVECPEHFMLECPAYDIYRQALWDKLNSDPAVASKVASLADKSDVEKLHCMLDERFWGIEEDEEGCIHGPFEHAFDSLAEYVHYAWRLRNRMAHASEPD
jgi:hypothetical protein